MKRKILFGSFLFVMVALISIGINAVGNRAGKCSKN